MRITRWLLLGVAAMAVAAVVYRLVAGRKENEDSSSSEGSSSRLQRSGPGEALRARDLRARGSSRLRSTSPPP